VNRGITKGMFLKLKRSSTLISDAYKTNIVKILKSNTLISKFQVRPTVCAFEMFEILTLFSSSKNSQSIISV